MLDGIFVLYGHIKFLDVSGTGGYPMDHRAQNDNAHPAERMLEPLPSSSAIPTLGFDGLRG
jgi:hypothetical protein